jgi:hypothetical protein
MTLVIGSTASETGSASIRMRTIAKHTLPSGEVIKIVSRGKSQAWHFALNLDSSLTRAAPICREPFFIVVQLSRVASAAFGASVTLPTCLSHNPRAPDNRQHSVFGKFNGRWRSR